MSAPTIARRSGRRIFGAAAAAVAGLAVFPSLAASARPATVTVGAKPTIVLEHGAWADASSWSGVIGRLHDGGFTVLAPPNPLRGGATDSANLASFLHTIPGPIAHVAGVSTRQHPRSRRWSTWMPSFPTRGRTSSSTPAVPASAVIP